MKRKISFAQPGMNDTGSRNFVHNFLTRLDEGNIFKNMIYTLMIIVAVLLLVGGFVITIIDIFGDRGFIQSSVANDNLSSGAKAGAIVGLVIGALVSLLTAWVLYSILKNRTDKINNLEYSGLLHFIFIVTFPRLILIIGELLFILLLYVGVLQVIAALIGSHVYAPLMSNYPDLVLGMSPGMDTVGGMMPKRAYGSYEHFLMFLGQGLAAILISFFVLIVFYIYKEVYVYFVRLVMVFINFLPRFAIPMSIRKRDEQPYKHEVVQ